MRVFQFVVAMVLGYILSEINLIWNQLEDLEYKIDSGLASKANHAATSLSERD